MATTFMVRGVLTPVTITTYSTWNVATVVTSFCSSTWRIQSCVNIRPAWRRRRIAGTHIINWKARARAPTHNVLQKSIQPLIQGR